MNAGIYCIENIVNKKIYIGQSKNMEKRITNHKRFLRNGLHSNIHLQNSYNKFGKENFSFRILEKIDDIKLLDKAENEWISYFKSFAGKNGYNIKYPTKVFRLTFSYMPDNALPKKICDFCNSEYPPVKTWQRFCCPECHNKHWVSERGSSSDRFKRIEKRIERLEKKLNR